MGRGFPALLAAVVLSATACTLETSSPSPPAVVEAIPQSLDQPVLSNGELPRPEAAEPIVIQTKSEAELQIGLINNKVVTVTDESTFRFAVSVVDSSGQPVPVSTDGALVVKPAHEISVVGSGLRPNSRAVAWVFSTPRRLGEVRVASDGSFSETFELPSDLPPGRHTTQVNAIDVDGDVRSFNLALVLQPAAPPLVTSTSSTTTTVRPTTTTTTVRPTTTTLRRPTTTSSSSTTTTSTSVPTTTTTSSTTTTTSSSTTTSTSVPTTTSTTISTATTTTVAPTTTTTTTTTTTVAPTTYSVTYNGNTSTSGAVPTDAGAYTTSSTVTVLGNTGTLAKAGYTFAGWCTTQPAAGAACTGTSRAVASTFSITADTTLYAVWTANTLTVTYDSQGGSAISSGSTMTGGQIASSPGAPTREGYTFAGWFAASSGGSAITFPYTHGQTANFTLFAQWTANTQTISYAAGTGGSGSAPSSPTTVSYGGTFTTPVNTYTRAGYTFAGWSDGSSTYAAAATYPASGTVSANVTLTATWTVATCAQGGTCVVGDTGPGGGVVFYVHASGTFACGPTRSSTCTYLEAAPDNWNGAGGDPQRAWSGNTGSALLGTSREIGYGYQNTIAAVAQDSGGSTADRAVTLADSYVNNGKSDWYLPSRDELNELCKYARTQSTGNTADSCASTGTLRSGFGSSTYWSSNQAANNGEVFIRSFGNGASGDNSKANSYRVRPIRAF